MKKTTIFILLAFLSLASQVLSQDTIRQKIDSIANIYLSRPNNVGLMVGIFRQRTSPAISPVAEYFGYGHVRKDTTSPVPDSLSVFKLGSVGKTFTATMLAFLMQYNIPPVTLFDRINKYLPDTLNIPVWVSGQDTTFITLGDLAMHFSSLPDTPPNHVPPPHYSIQLMLEFINNYSLPHKPGTVWIYSNAAFGLLGIIESIITNQTYESLSNRVISDSLGMPDTRVFPTVSMQSRIALGYNHNTGNPDTVSTSPGFYGAGGHYSSMKDMMHYLRYQMGFVDKPSMNILLDTLHKERRHSNNDTTSWQGLAWQMNYLYRGQSIEKRIWKDGATAGYSTFICWLPKTRSGVVMLSNSTDGVDSFAVKILRILNPIESLGGIGIQQISSNVPDKFVLHQNYPNPFNPTTKIRFELPKNNGFVSLKIYNVLGQLVSNPVNKKLLAGTYEYEFDASGLNSGMYFYSLSVDGKNIQTKKMAVIK